LVLWRHGQGVYKLVHVGTRPTRHGSTAGAEPCSSGVVETSSPLVAGTWHLKCGWCCMWWRTLALYLPCARRRCCCRRRMALMVRILVMSPWLASSSSGWVDGQMSMRYGRCISHRWSSRCRTPFYTGEYEQPGRSAESSGQVRAGGRGALTSTETNGDDAEQRASFHTDEHELPGIDISELATMGWGGDARSTSNGDSLNSVGQKASGYTHEYDKSGLEITGLRWRSDGFDEAGLSEGDLSYWIWRSRGDCSPARRVRDLLNSKPKILKRKPKGRIHDA